MTPTPPTLQELPPPPAGKVGWPWTEASTDLPPTPPGAAAWPKISIVTPSFNQGHFLEETIRSVLLQRYPNLEYFVMDGGSRDDSAAVIRRYERWLTGWVSEKDRGQSHAINKGFERATGDLITFQNSDDLYLPNAFGEAGRRWAARPEAGVVVGGFYYIDGHTMRRDPIPPRLPNEGPIDLVLTPPEAWRMHQVSVFYARHALDRAGRHVREDLYWTMDRDLLYRVCRIAPVLLSQENFGAFRWHDSGKSFSNYLKADMEYADLHLSYSYDNKAEQQQARTIADIRRARGYLRFAKGCGSIRQGLGALIRGVRCHPAMLWRKEFFNAIVRVLRSHRSRGATAIYL